MIASSKTLLLSALAAVALASAGCSVAAEGQIPCVDDSSCPVGFPVCGSGGKCVAGSSSTKVSAQIVGVAGKQSGQPVHGTVTVQVAARSDSGVKSVSLSGGGQTFASAAGATGPNYDLAVDTTRFTDGAVSLTATVTPGDTTVQPVTSTPFALTVDNTAPVLTSSATLPPAQLGSMVSLDVTASEALQSIDSDLLFAGDVVGKATELSTPTGNVHHLGFAVVSAAATGTYTFRVTAADLAGNTTAAALNKTFDVPASPSGTLSADTTNISVGASANLTATFSNGTGAVTANPADASLPGTITSGQPFAVSPAVNTTYALLVTNAAGATVARTVTVVVGQAVTVSLTAPASASPGQSVNLVANVSANAQQAFVVPGNFPVTANGNNQNVPVSAAVTTTFTLVATNSAGAEFRTTASLNVTQPVITSFSGPDVITTGTGPSLTVNFTPPTATVSVPGCAGGAVTGTSPASQTFNCSAIGTGTTYTASAALGTATAQATLAVQVAGDLATTAFSFPGGAINPGAQANFNGTGCTPACTVTFNPPVTIDTGFLTGGFTAHLTTNPTSTTTVVMTVSTSAGVSTTRTATATVTQPSITSFTGPDAVTVGQGFTLTALFSPGTATTTVAGCVGGAVSGAGPFQRQFTCPSILTDTTFTLDVTLGTAVIHATTSVQAAPDPASGLVFQASPPALPFSGSTPSLIVQFCGGSPRCVGTYSVNGGAPIPVASGANPPITQTATSTYTLVVTNSAASSTTAQVTVPTYGSTFATNTMSAARIGAATAMLPNGKILVAGGTTNGLPATGVASAEIFDPSTGLWSAVACSCGGGCGGSGTPQATMHSARFQATATTLANGTVLITGGTNTGGTALATVDVYDPSQDCFRLNGNPLNTPRDAHTATAYNGGNNAVIIGGTALKTCEVFQQGGTIITGTFTACSGPAASIDMQVNRASHVAPLLPGGRYVLAAGGSGDRSADIYDTASNGDSGFTNLSTTVMQVSRTSPTATLLSSGKVLVAGGGSATAELFTFNPVGPTGSTAATGSSMGVSRTGHAAIALNGGAVLMAGGNASLTVDVYDPVANSFGAGFSLNTARAQATFGFTLLLGGRALVGGGTAAASAAEQIVP